MDKGQAMKALRNKVIVRIDTKQKERYAMSNGAVLEISRGFNFNLREDLASLGYCLCGENIPENAPVLINYLGIDPTYELPYQHELLSEEEIKHGYKIYSCPVDMIFCFKENNEWKPCKDFLITKRIFKPYEGILHGIQTEQVKNRMFVVRGSVRDEEDKNSEYIDLSGKCVVSLVNSDYQILWTNPDNKEETLIRTRNREIEAVDDGLTNDVYAGEYLVGNTLKDAEKIQKHEYC